MTNLKTWINRNEVNRVQVQTDNDAGTFMTRAMDLVLIGEAVYLNGKEWNDSDIDGVATSTLYMIDNNVTTITLHKADV